MQYGLRCGKEEGRHFEVVEYQSILVKVTLCKEGGFVEMAMVAWKTVSTRGALTASCISSTECFCPLVFGRRLASRISESFNGRQSPRGSRRVSVSLKMALEIQLIAKSSFCFSPPCQLLETAFLQLHPTLSAGAVLSEGGH